MTYSMGLRAIIILAAVAILWPIQQAKAVDDAVQWNGFMKAQFMDRFCSPQTEDKKSKTRSLLACNMYIFGLIDSERLSDHPEFCIPDKARIKTVLAEIRTNLHEVVEYQKTQEPARLEDGSPVPSLATVLIKQKLKMIYPCK